MNILSTSKAENISYFCNQNNNKRSNRQMKPYYIHILGIIFCLASCIPHSKHWETLMQVESFMEERPDSALTVLQELDKEDLLGKEEHAQYALLLSMAMDKNYIDRTDFEVLQPAIEYYLNHGTATDKLRTFYYEGRIYMNRNDNVSAIISFNKALNKGEKSHDIKTKARTHFAQANIYRKLYKIDRYTEENKLAAHLFQKAGLPNSYANCLIQLINSNIINKDKENAKKHINLYQSIWDSINSKRQHDFYTAQLNYTIEYGTKEEIAFALDEYRCKVPQKEWDWLSITRTYLALNDNEQAYLSIQNYQSIPNLHPDARYYAILSELYSNLNDPEKALNAYINYTSITDSIDLDSYEQTTRLIEELHKSELQSIKEQEKSERVIILSVIMVLVLLAICIVIRIRLVTRTRQKVHMETEKEKYRLQCLQIEEEYANLSRLLARQHELSETTQQILAERTSLLNKFFVTYIKSYGEAEGSINDEIEKLVTDKDAFINSNRVSFSGSHPKFIYYLEEKGLTEWEINYCCLYALGLNGKEIGTYIKMRSHYNQSSIIREKLGIGEHNTNLGLYIRKLLKELPSG